MNIRHLVATLCIALSFVVGGCSSNKSQSSDQSQTSDSATSVPTPTPTQAPDLSAQTRDTPEPRNTPRPKYQLNAVSMNDSVHHLMNAYTGLRSRAVDIIDQIADGANNAEVVGNVGQQWYSDERDFQAQVRGLPTSLNTNSQYMLIASNLDEVETFLYSAGADAMMSCDTHTARRDLEAADYFFHAVQKEMNTGQSSPEDAGNPPQVDLSDHSCGN
jgi:hypothetical protein